MLSNDDIIPAKLRWLIWMRAGTGVRNITYDITELYGFIDGLGDLCCLVRIISDSSIYFFGMIGK